jgi:predicted TPR repeat methyltransferase
VLTPGGLFAFTVQQAQTGDYELGGDFRYAHSRAYLTRLMQSYGYEILVCDDVSVRQDRGVAVPGLALVVAAP